LVPVAIIGIWWLISATHAIQPSFLASPPQVVRTFGRLFAHQDLLGQIGWSVRRALEGAFFGCAAGLVLGVLSGLFALGEEMIDAAMQMLRTIPFLAILPLIVLWLGIGELPKIVLIAVATAFPVYLNTYNGVKNVDRRVVEAAKVFGVTGFPLVRRVVLPLALPSILTGVRFSLGVSVLALVAAEQINAKEGIGYLVLQAQNFQEVDVMMAGAILYAVFGLLADLTIRIVEHFVLPWRRTVAVR
jgi:sulfonate transport system permease protein